MITEPEMIKSALCDLERKMDAQLNQRLSELLDNQSKMIKIDEKRIADLEKIVTSIKNVSNGLERPEQYKNVISDNYDDEYLESKSKAIKKSFTDCMSSSTGHGLPQIVKDGSLFLKILWAIFFVAGVTATIFMIYNTLENFFQYDVITTTRIKSEKEIVFPVVTFCLTDNSSIRNALSGCQFGRFPKLSCNLTELTLYTKQSIKRSCIQLGNSNKGSESYKSIGEGYSYGFQLYIYHPPQSIIKFSITENGMKVVNDQIRYNIFARHETELGLSVTQEYSLGPPYSDCISTQEYSMEHCISECYEKKMSSVCDCEYPSGCKAQSQWPKECLYAYNNSLSLYVSQCRIGCQSRCHKTFYTFTRLDIELDSNRIKLDQIKSDLEKNFNFSGKSDDQIIKRLSKIYIYFDKLETTVIRQIQSFTIISLIANVGGILGLFLGFSLLSSIETLDLVIRIIWILTKTNKSKSNSRVSPA